MSLKDQLERPDSDLAHEHSAMYGLPYEVSLAAVRSFKNVLGLESDAEAHQPDAEGNRGPTITRVEAAWTDPNDPKTDPSPNPGDIPPAEEIGKLEN